MKREKIFYTMLIGCMFLTSVLYALENNPTDSQDSLKTTISEIKKTLQYGDSLERIKALTLFEEKLNSKKISNNEAAQLLPLLTEIFKNPGTLPISEDEFQRDLFKNTAIQCQIECVVIAGRIYYPIAMKWIDIMVSSDNPVVNRFGIRMKKDFFENSIPLVIPDLDEGSYLIFFKHALTISEPSIRISVIRSVLKLPDNMAGKMVFLLRSYYTDEQDFGPRLAIIEVLTQLAEKPWKDARSSCLQIFQAMSAETHDEQLLQAIKKAMTSLSKEK